MSRKTEVPDPEAYPDLISDPDEIARVESLNALEQFDYAMAVVAKAVSTPEKFRLMPELICELNRLATQGIKKNAGQTRTVAIGIKGSNHQPPHPADVDQLIADLCNYVEAKWDSPPIHLAAYLLWRINWIHPFEDGNGRTARMLSYVVLCIRLGFPLPGTCSIPEQIVGNKEPYYRALEAADLAFGKDVYDLRSLEKLLSRLLANQLEDLHDQACAGTGSDGP